MNFVQKVNLNGADESIERLKTNISRIKHIKMVQMFVCLRFVEWYRQTIIFRHYNKQLENPQLETKGSNLVISCTYQLPPVKFPERYMLYKVFATQSMSQTLMIRKFWLVRGLLSLLL